MLVVIIMIQLTFYMMLLSHPTQQCHIDLHALLGVMVRNAVKILIGKSEGNM
jgi:hypothetical protein